MTDELVSPDFISSIGAARDSTHDSEDEPSPDDTYPIATDSSKLRTARNSLEEMQDPDRLPVMDQEGNLGTVHKSDIGAAQKEGFHVLDTTNPEVNTYLKHHTEDLYRQIDQLEKSDAEKNKDRILAAALGAKNTILAIPNLLGQINESPEEKEMRETEREASKTAEEAYPTASAIGSLAGAFVPGTPISLAAGAPFKLAAPILKTLGKTAAKGFGMKALTIGGKVLTNAGASALSAEIWNINNNVSEDQIQNIPLSSEVVTHNLVSSLALGGGIGAGLGAIGAVGAAKAAKVPETPEWSDNLKSTMESAPTQAPVTETPPPVIKFAADIPDTPPTADHATVAGQAFSAAEKVQIQTNMEHFMKQLSTSGPRVPVLDSVWADHLEETKNLQDDLEKKISPENNGGERAPDKRTLASDVEELKKNSKELHEQVKEKTELGSEYMKSNPSFAPIWKELEGIFEAKMKVIKEGLAHQSTLDDVITHINEGRYTEAQKALSTYADHLAPVENGAEHIPTADNIRNVRAALDAIVAKPDAPGILDKIGKSVTSRAVHHIVREGVGFGLGATLGSIAPGMGHLAGYALGRPLGNLVYKTLAESIPKFAERVGLANIANSTGKTAAQIATLVNQHLEGLSRAGIVGGETALRHDDVVHQPSIQSPMEQYMTIKKEIDENNASPLALHDKIVKVLSPAMKYAPQVALGAATNLARRQQVLSGLITHKQDATTSSFVRPLPPSNKELRTVLAADSVSRNPVGAIQDILTGHAGPDTWKYLQAFYPVMADRVKNLYLDGLSRAKPSILDRQHRSVGNIITDGQLSRQDTAFFQQLIQSRKAPSTQSTTAASKMENIGAEQLALKGDRRTER
jgi:hypothetical protein